MRSNLLSMAMKGMLRLALAGVCLMVAMASEGQIVSKATLKYLEGAVPVVDGIVTYEEEIEFPLRSKDQVYAIVAEYIDSLVAQSEHEEYSRVTDRNADEGLVAASVAEYMYFKRGKWSTDFCHFRYQIIATCEEGKAVVKIWRINYVYDEERYAQNATYTAEEWITDENALKKGSNELKKQPGKFRKGTVDRVERIMADIAALN